MQTNARVGRLVPFLLLVPVWTVRAQAPASEHTKVTIRGTGSDVLIERTPAAPASRAQLKNAFARPRPAAAAPAAPSLDGVLAETIRLKSAGADDTVVLAYLRGHQGLLPPVIDAEDVKALRAAGAGKAVLTSLATLTAVDIGETGEGYEVMEAMAPPESSGGPDDGMFGAPYGYPVAVTYGPARGRHFGHHFRPRPVLVPRARIPMRSMGAVFPRREFTQ